MKSMMILVPLASALICSVFSATPAAAQDQDLVTAVKKVTAELAAADKVVVAARNRLFAAKSSLDTSRFNSAAYSARVATQQETAAREKYEKVDPKLTEEKENALELYQLAQELAATRKTALQAAEKLLPIKETEANAAEEKYTTALASAEKLAGQIKSLVRQTETETRAKVQESKHAIESAAFAKATAEQRAATNTQTIKLMANLVAADAVLRRSAIALQKATDKDRPQKLVEARKATVAFAATVTNAAQYLPAFKVEQAKAVGWTVSASLVDADKGVQKATAALNRATQNIQNRNNAVKQAEARIKAGQEGVKNRIAKIRAQKDLVREQAAAKRAAEAKLEAEKALPLAKAESDKIKQQYANALQAAVLVLARAPEVEKALAIEKLAIVKTALDKASAEKAAAEKVLVDKSAVARQAEISMANADKTLTAAQATADKIDAQKTAAEKVIAAKIAAAKAATDAAAGEQDPAKKKIAEEAVAKAMTEKAVAEKALAKTFTVLPKTGDALVAARSAQGPIKANAEKANTEKAIVEKLVAEKTVQFQKATADFAAATKADNDAKAAVQTATANRAAIAKAVADKKAELNKENENLTRAAAESQVVSEKAQLAVAAANKLLAERNAAREALLRIQRKRSYRAASTAQAELRRSETRLAAANKERRPKVSALTKAVVALKQAKAAAVKVQKNADVQAGLVANATKAKDAAQKTAQELLSAKAAVEQKAKVAQAAAVAAQEVLKIASAPEKKTAEKLVQESNAAKAAIEQKAKQAQAPAKAAQVALDKALAALKAVEAKSGQAITAAKAAEQKTTALQAAVNKATADKNAVDQKIIQSQQAIEVAQAKISIAKSAAYGGLKPIVETEWSYSRARHLLVRAGFGGTPDEVAKLHSMGVHRAVSSLVNFSSQPPAEIAFVAKPKERAENYETSLSSTEQRLLRDERLAKDRGQIQNMRTWWLRRMIESPRQLEEKLTLFWHGTIPAQYSEVGDSYYMYLQNQLFRENAAGNFGALLNGIAHDAAMLKYLNNDTNIKGKANENLARELMELFSMGRDQGYSEIDIRQGARALTGYTYDPMTGQFRFISQRHDTEPKTIFGKKGNWNGDDFTRMILETPYPAKFIAQKMFVFFAHDEPSADTVEALANVLKVNNYELKPMLENLFLSEEFYSSNAMQTQIKGPIQLVVGLHRDLGLKNADYGYLVSAVRGMGQELFEPPSVFGWQSGRTWVSTSRTFARYNSLAEILERRPRNGKAGVDVVGTLLTGKPFKDHAEVVDYLVKSVCNVPLADSKRLALIEFLKPLPPTAEWAAKSDVVNSRLTRLLVMLICSPESQLT